MAYCKRVEWLEFQDALFFTAVFLPCNRGTFPTVIYRTPYVKGEAALSESEILEKREEAYRGWLERGYAVVFQHCRGQGKSTGDFIPYLSEREDGRYLRQWIRRQSFYNGEIFLCGGSYTSSVHYATAPFESDVKGAVLEIQDSERYRLWYRNGQMRKGHANWHFSLCRRKGSPRKEVSLQSFSRLPLAGLSEEILGFRAEDFEEMLFAPSPSDPFWNTRLGGAEARGATDEAGIPILLTTGYQDYYVGGVFSMWNAMSENTRKQCALLVSPYHHGDSYHPTDGLAFPKGKRVEQFGARYPIDWCDHIRTGAPLPYAKGEITYYRMFENVWEGSFYARPVREVSLPLGAGVASFSYDPKRPPAFREGGVFRQAPTDGADAVTLFLRPFARDVFIKGAIKAALTVSSDCPDTSFYVCISIEKPQGDYVLRHDITSLCYQLGSYRSGQRALLHFRFDECAFLLKKGERLRIDVSSTDDNTYVCHTNQKGPYACQTRTAVANNRVELDSSVITLPIEEEEG